MTTAQAPDRVSVESDITFGAGGGRSLRCDIYRPPASVKKGTSVLLVHGGGWSQGDRSQLRGFGILLGRIGYTCVATEYRLTGEAPWPAQIHDVKACLRWMKAQASDLAIDPTRIVVEGNSAGAHLSLMVAGTPNLPAFEGDGGNPGVDTSVAASIAIYPPTNFQGLLGDAIKALFKGNDTEAVRAAASPLTYAKPGHPPTLLIHGNKDTIVPPDHSTTMYEALDKAGVPVELHMYAGQPHAFDESPRLGRQVADIMASFVERYVD
jgi:acetyl esterase/lipase